MRRRAIWSLAWLGAAALVGVALLMGRGSGDAVAAVTVAAVLVMLVVLVVGTLLIALGIAMLALEFVWAARLVTRMVHHAETAAGKARTARQRPRTVVLAAAVGALVVAPVVAGASLAGAS